ncbi:MAG: flagellar type III secretion system protein FlhB [Pseudomonadota bacterium]
MSEENADSGQEKSLDPSPARLEKARRDGDVAQSKELTAALSYLAFFLCAILASNATARGILTGSSAAFNDPLHTAQILFSASGESAAAQMLQAMVLPGAIWLLLAPAFGAAVSVIAQRAVVFAPKKLSPKLSRISIVENAKKKFGVDGLAEFAKSLAKLIAVCACFFFIFSNNLSDLLVQAAHPATALPKNIMRQSTLFLGVIVLFSLLVAAIDLPWTQHQYVKRHRTTREEAKKENKETEGDPEIKGKRRDKSRTIAQNRMMQDVPNADVVLVNPTHFAVALSWERNKDQAPICVAKGTDELAMKIREIAVLSGVPLRHDPPTARAVWSSVEVGEEIKREHYSAIAAAFHFADKVRKQSVAYGAQQ